MVLTLRVENVCAYVYTDSSDGLARSLHACAISDPRVLSAHLPSPPDLRGFNKKAAPKAAPMAAPPAAPKAAPKPSGQRFVNTSAARAPPQAMPPPRGAPPPQTMPQAGGAPPVAAPAPAQGMGMMGMVGSSMAGSMAGSMLGNAMSGGGGMFGGSSQPAPQAAQAAAPQEAAPSMQQPQERCVFENRQVSSWF